MRSKMSGMQIGSCCMGDRMIEGGSYEKLSILGTLKASDASIMNLSVAGSAKLTNCEIGSMSVAGEVVCSGGHVDFVEIAGAVSFREQVNCGGIHLLGGLKNENTICHILKYGSFKCKLRHLKKPYIDGYLRADTLENFFPLEVNAHQVFQNIINFGELLCKETLECAHFFTFNSVNLHELNADFAYLYPCAHVQIKEFHGSLLIVDPIFDLAWLKDVAYDVEIKDFSSNASCNMVSIDYIEADEVVLDYVKCKSISARRVVLGPHCEVDVVEYEESCKIHEEAKVKERTSL